MEWKKLILAGFTLSIISFLSIFVLLFLYLVSSLLKSGAFLLIIMLVYFLLIGLLVFFILRKFLKIEVKDSKSLFVNILIISFISTLISTPVLFIMGNQFCHLDMPGSVYCDSYSIDSILLSIPYILLVLPHNPITLFIASYIAWKYLKW